MATLTISFIAPNPTPANGYVIKYRVKGSNSSYTSITANSSPVSITGLLANTDYEGTIQSDCGGGFLSSAVGYSSCTPASNLQIKIISNTAET